MQPNSVKQFQAQPDKTTDNEHEHASKTQPKSLIEMQPHKSLPLFRRANLDEQEIQRKDQICRMLSAYKPKKKRAPLRLIDLPARIFVPG